MAGRARLAETLVELADAWDEGPDEADLLCRAVHRCPELLDAEASALSLGPAAPGRTVPAAVAISSARVEPLRRGAGDLAQGPAAECVRTRARVVAVGVDALHRRWPALAPDALSAGFSALAALPVRRPVRGIPEVLGVLLLYRPAGRPYTETDLESGQLLAGALAVGLAQHRARHRHAVLTAQLNGALTSRVVVEQAKGVLAERWQVDVDRAFAVLRGWCRAHNRRLPDTAAAVVRGEQLPGLVPYAAVRGRPGAR